MRGVWEVPPPVCTNFSPRLVGSDAAAARVAMQPDPEARRVRLPGTAATLPPLHTHTETTPTLGPAWRTAGVAPGLCGEE